MPAPPPPDPRQESPEHLAAYRLATARHNIMTPLAVIQGSAQLLQRRLGRLEGVGEADLVRLHRPRAAIERACRELAAVVERLDEVDPRGSQRADSSRRQERGDGNE